MVRQKAAAALGELADPNDQQVKASLHEAMASTGTEMREVVWNAAIALARLGDEQGAQFVATVLLDRQTLAQLPAGESAPAGQETLSRSLQDRVILSTLAAARTMTNPKVWDKIKQLADKDPNRAVQSAARQVLATRLR